MAGDEFKVDVSGLEGVERAMRALDRSVRNDLAERAARAGAKVLERGVAARIPRGTGSRHMADSIDSKAVVLNRAVLVEVGGKAPDGSLFHLVEFGTSPHSIEQPKLGRTIEHPGAAAKPFMRPAVDEDGPEAVKVTGKTLGRLIEAEAARQRRR